MKTSSFLRLDWRDLFKAFLVALIAFLLDFLQKTFIPALDLSPETKTMILAGLAYIAKNFATPAKKVEYLENIGLPKPKDPK